MAANMHANTNTTNSSIPNNQVAPDLSTTSAAPKRHMSVPCSMENGATRSEFTIDGRALPHWDRSNFQLEQDLTCRYVYKPIAHDYFETILQP